MSNHRDHLSGAYGLQDQASTTDYYDDWADTYDVELTENGYITPARCAKALAQCVEHTDIAVLDIGCGTGISGNALRNEGFQRLTGTDISQKMLDKAIKADIYNDVWLMDTENPFPFPAGKYQAITAVGVIGSGAAPVQVFHDACDRLNSGNKFVLSLNDHALVIPEFPQAISGSISSGMFKLLFKEYGPHIPGKNMNSNVYVLERI